MKALIAALTALMMFGSIATAELPGETQTGTISLAANATTGYAWTGFVIGGDAVEIDSNEGTYIPDDNPDGLTGVGGTPSFTVTAVQPGRSIILFDYLRPEDRASEDQRIYLAIVDEEMNLSLSDVTEYSPIEGVVTGIDADNRSATLNTEDRGEVIVRFGENDSLPTQDEHIRAYTDGIMTMSLPPIVNAIAWEHVPSDLARDAEDAPAEDGSN